MWSRFTERARRVVWNAEAEAAKCNGKFIDTEHFLLALTREDDSVAARVLDRIGIPVAVLGAEALRELPSNNAFAGKNMMLTPRAKRVIDLAYDEARALSNNYIGTEHLLLALIREPDGLAGRVLAKSGADLERARDEVRKLQRAESGMTPAPDQQIPDS